MNIDIVGFDDVHPVDGSAAHPIEPLPTRLGALLLLAGMSPLRRRAYPDTMPAAHSGVPNYFF